MTTSAAGKCDKCGCDNSYRMMACLGCGHRLPWADELHRQVAPIPSPVATSSGNVAPAFAETDSPAALVGYALLSALMPCVGFIAALFVLSRGNTPRGLAMIIGAMLPFLVLVLLSAG